MGFLDNLLRRAVNTAVDATVENVAEQYSAKENSPQAGSLQAEEILPKKMRQLQNMQTVAGNVSSDSVLRKLQSGKSLNMNCAGKCPVKK